MESLSAKQPQEFVTLTELEDTFCEVGVFPDRAS